MGACPQNRHVPICSPWASCTCIPLSFPLSPLQWKKNSLQWEAYVHAWIWNKFSIETRSVFCFLFFLSLDILFYLFSCQRSGQVKVSWSLRMLFSHIGMIQCSACPMTLRTCRPLFYLFVALSPGPFPAFQYCTLKSWKRGPGDETNLFV